MEITKEFIDGLESRYGFKDYAFFNKNDHLILNIKKHDKNIFFSTYNNKSILIINY